MAEVRITVSGQEFLRDTRPLQERVQTWVLRGQIAPESLTLFEIQTVCEFALSMLRGKPTCEDGQPDQSTIQAIRF